VEKQNIATLILLISNVEEIRF